MTALRCPECGAPDVELVNSNNSRDGKSTRVEVFACLECGYRFSQVLRP